MIRNILLSTVAALLVATTAQAKVDGMVKEIVVEVDLTALVNPAAATRYATIATDLQGALAARLVDRIADEGMRLSIDLSEVELSNSFQDAVGLADTKLVGNVKFSDENNNTNFEAYELTVSYDQAQAFFVEGVDYSKLGADTDEHYKAMIDAFADSVVRRMDE